MLCKILSCVDSVYITKNYLKTHVTFNMQCGYNNLSVKQKIFYINPDLGNLRNYCVRRAPVSVPGVCGCIMYIEKILFLILTFFLDATNIFNKEQF